MPGQPIVLDSMGGLVVTSRPEDIPEGASPRTWDTDFIVGRFMQRPGEQSVFTYKTPVSPTRSGTVATDVVTSVTPWANPANVLGNGGGSATVSLGSKTLNLVSTEGVSYTDPVTLQTLYYILVTFSGLVPPVGSTYTFSGLTAHTFLNGKIIFSVEAPWGVNGGITLNSNQALFFWGDSVYASEADTGAASITYSSYVSDQIWVKGFGFALTSGFTVSGFTVNVKGFAPSATVFAQMVKNGVLVGEVKYAQLPTSLDTVNIGGDKDTWQEAWDYTDPNNANFGVAVWVTSNSPNAVSLDWVTIKITEGSAGTNFNGSASAKVDQNTQLTFHLDSNGVTWIEDQETAPNELYAYATHPLLNPPPLIPKAVPGSYLKGVDANGTAYLAYSDLTQGTSAPMQYNGQWCDRITQVGPGAPPVFTASTDAGAQSIVSAYSASAGVLTLTIGALGSAYVAGLLVTFSDGTGALAALNGLTFSVLGSPAPTTTSFAIATTAVTGSGSDTATVTPQYTYPIAASPNGIVQPPAQSDPDSAGHFSALLWSAGPGQKTAGNVVTVYYKNSFTHTTPDQTLVDAFNSGRPVYVYIANAPFGNGTWQVTSLGNAIPPGAGYYRWYFTYQVPTSNYQFYGGPDDATGTYQLTYATITTTTAVPGLAAGNQIILQNVTNSNWDHTYDVTAALNSGSYSITQSDLTAGVATYSWSLLTGSAPVPGQLVTVTGTLNANGQLNVTDAVVQSSTGTTSGTFTVSGFSTVADYPSAIEAGQATTAGTQFIIDPGAALVGSTQSPIIGNSGGGTLTVVGASIGGSFPIDPGTYQGTVFFITRNGAVTRPAPPFMFTVTAGANYITASQIPIGPDDVIARGISFTEPGANGIPGGNFYTYDTAVQFAVGGTKYTASALIVPDNVTTTMKFTFSTSVLLSSDEIDIPGNDYFNLIEIGDPAWMYQYANRMFYGLCRTKIQNFLNMSFDGGYLPNPNGLPMPLGWNSPGFPQVTYDITEFTIVSNVVTFAANNHLVAGNQVFIDGLATGTYLNGLVLTVLSAGLSSTQFSAAFTHADVGITADSGTATVINQQIGLITSPVFGNAFQILNQGTSALTETVILYQSAYQDWLNVPILNINTGYSVRLTAKALNVDGQLVSIRLFDPDTQTQYGFAVFTLNTGDPVEVSSGFATPIATIPPGLQIQIIATNLAAGGGVEIDRVEVFETNRPVDTTTIWVSYADKFESVDINTGRLGVGLDNPQPAVGAYQILEQLYIEKTNSLQVTQDSPNYEPNEWSVHQASEKTGSVGPNAFDEGEEFSLAVARNGVYYFDGGKKMPISRELQSTGFQGSLWESINWNAKQTIWCRNDFLNRRVLIGVPMITPNFFLPYAPAETPTSPNVILMCNYTGCPTGDELAEASEVHTTMFGDLKALDMRRKWSIWQVRCPSASFIPREDGETELLLGNGIGSGKIYRFANGAPANGQNTDDGEPINWLYTTYGFMKAKQGQQLGMTGLRKVAEYMTATMEGVGQVACRILINTLGALGRNIFQVRPNFTLSYPAQNDQESNLEVAGQRLFFEFSSVGTGGYAEIGQLMVDMAPDMHSPHRGIRA